MNVDPAEARYRAAEAALAEYLERVESGERLSFQGWKESRAEIASELERLHAEWRELEEALADSAAPDARTSAGPIERLRELEPTASLLLRLRAQPRSSDAHATGRRIGAGGMGEVFAIRDAILRRELAMKVLRSDPADALDPGRNARRIARFLEEAQIMAQLDHPGIVPVHELGVDAEGRPFLTMKRVRGRTLADEFARRHAEGTVEPSSLTRCLTHLLRVCEAMTYAHARGVIHRDLKPSNVMLGDHGEVYVMDWGLARVLAAPGGSPEGDSDPVVLLTDRSERREGAPGSSAYTRTGQGLGTAQYMPPEQALGRWQEVDARADVYALGAMLYHLLAGRSPYADSTAGAEEIRARVIAGPPRPLAHVRRQAPAQLVAICERAMARERTLRYGSVAELADDLRAYLDGRVVRAHATGPWAEFRQWLRRNRRVALAGGGMLISAFVATVSLIVLYTESKSRSEIERMAAILANSVRFDRLLELTNDLWPPHPDLIPAMQAWVTSAQSLTSSQESLRNAVPGVGPQPPLSSTDEIAAQESRLAKLEGELDTIRTSFDSTDSLDPIVIEALSGPVFGMENMVNDLLAEHGFGAPFGWSLPKRLHFARELEREFSQGGQYASAWTEALPELREAYPDIDWKPQMGLVPLGPDPETGLWEFAHLMSGPPAVRGVDDRLVLSVDTGIVLVLLPGGVATLGAQAANELESNYDPIAHADEGPVHEVELSPFFLSKYEMTQRQWLQITAVEPSYYKARLRPPEKAHPVESVSWTQSWTWLNRAGLTLPTEAQWEYGVRGGTSTPYWTGADRTELARRKAANLADASTLEHGVEWDLEPGLDDGFPVHAPVGTFAPNDFGLHDMTGNVWEWCRDNFKADFYRRSPRRDPWNNSKEPKEDPVSYVYRGGSFLSLAVAARSSARLNAHADYADATLGVRAARELDP